MVDIRQWLESLRLGEYADMFEKNMIEPDFLGELTDSDLRDLGVDALGHRKRILRAVSELDAAPAAPAPATNTVQPMPAREAERRQLTVMFCDLVGSTQLSQQLDPEELRDVITTFQDTCKGTVEAHGGYIARYMGDGVLVYFGYPTAGEDDAERAVRAGETLIERVTAPGSDTTQSVRVGIATGPVVVGDLIGEGASQESAVIGETPNLAARLQGEAAPNTVLVSELTQSLTQGFFEFEELGPRTLKGFDSPQQIWRVTGDRTLESRFEALRDPNLSEFVGRRSEFGLLTERWEAAMQGEGQVVLIGGEAGVGKSRLSEELIVRAGANAQHVLRYQCAPNQTNTAYFPFIHQLWQAAALTRDDAPERKLDKIDAFAATRAPDAERAPALLAALMSLPTTRYRELGPRPGQEKAETIGVLEIVFEGATRSGPALAVFEDVHWADPSTLEVLNSLVAAAAMLPVLMVVTHRPEFQPTWQGHGHVTELRLSNLRRADCMAIIDRLCGHRGLPEKLCREILSRTDGVPLFVEELTKAVLSSGMLVSKGDEYVQVGSASELTIPSTLNDSLMARLDRLGSARAIAQIGACVGREFSYPLVLAVSAAPAEQVDEALRELEAEQLIYRRGEPPQARYTFKHALIRDAAAGSLLKQDKGSVHRRIAAVFEAAAGTRDNQPELLAHHYSEAGAAEEAVTYWLRAAQRASRQQAYREAIAQVMAGLELLQQLPRGPERNQREIDFQMVLGSAYSLSKGFGSVEGERAYTRAQQLFEEVGLDDPNRRFAVLSGLRRSYTHHGQFDAAEKTSRELLQIAEQTQESYMLKDAHYSLGTMHWLGGNYVAAVEQFERGLRHEDIGGLHNDRESASAGDAELARDTYIGSTGAMVANSSTGAIALWECGYADRARRWCARVLEFERTLNQPFWNAYYLSGAGFLSQRMKNYDALQEQASRAHESASEIQQQMLMGWSRAMLGWVRAMRGDAEQGCRDLEQGIDTANRSGSIHNQQRLEAMLAEACMQCNRVEEGLAAIARATRLADLYALYDGVAETRRIKAGLLLLADPSDRNAVEACLREAIDIAVRQNAKSLELRCTVDLARVLAGSGRRREARDQLSAIYTWFTEGFDTWDLTQAKVFLEKLQ